MATVATPRPQSRRLRSEAYPTFEAPDEKLQSLVDTLKRQTGNPAVLNGALATLADLTSWKSQNQLGVVDVDGLGALLALVKQSAAATSPPPPPRAAAATSRLSQAAAVSSAAANGCGGGGGGINETPKLALWVLMNLSANDLLSPRISAAPGCIADLVTLMVSRACTLRGMEGGGRASLVVGCGHRDADGAELYWC